jgi:hypothetical protein
MYKKIYLFALIILTGYVNSYGQTENVASRFFFPGMVGVGIPSGDDQTSMRTGFALNTALEYRPVYTNSYFYRFNFDNISNQYYANSVKVPTNVKYGKMNTDFFLLGAGYRRKLKLLSLYFLIQPGYNISNYEVVGSLNTAYSIKSISRHYFSEKMSVGAEYYIVPHFALVFEPSYYHLFSLNSASILNPNYVSINIGFTTTLF